METIEDGEKQKIKSARSFFNRWFDKTEAIRVFPEPGVAKTKK
jgi:hypothetical protein